MSATSLLALPKNKRAALNRFRNNKSGNGFGTTREGLLVIEEDLRNEKDEGIP
jgi:hypothetical protein